MILGDFKILASNWKVSIETSDYDLCKKTCPKLCYYILNSGKIKSKEIHSIKSIAEKIFSDFHSPILVPKIMEMVNYATMKNDTAFPSGLLRLKEILEETFPTICHKEIYPESEERRKEAQLLAIPEQEHNKAAVPQQCVSTLCQNFINKDEKRKLFLKELKQGLGKSLLSDNEIFFEKSSCDFLLNFSPSSSQETHALFETEEFWQFDEEPAHSNSTSWTHFKIDLSETIAKAHLLLMRFYSCVPELLISSKDSKSYDDHFSKNLNSCYHKQLKIIVLWVLIHSLDETISLDKFISVLQDDEFFKIDVKSDAIGSWINSCASLFLEAINKDLDFEKEELNQAIRLCGEEVLS